MSKYVRRARSNTTRNPYIQGGKRRRIWMSKELENEQRVEEAIARASSRNPEPIPVPTEDSEGS